jgi:hypothetical protein
MNLSKVPVTPEASHMQNSFEAGQLLQAISLRNRELTFHDDTKPGIYPGVDFLPRL